jgi:acetyl esterase/lipase
MREVKELVRVGGFRVTTVALTALVLVAAFALLIVRTNVPSDVFRSLGPEGAQTPDSASMDADGVVHLPPLAVPFSTFASPEAKAEFLRSEQYNKSLAAHGPMSVDEERRAVDTYFGPALARVRSIYPVVSSHDVIAGVKVDTITPKDGISPRNAHRVLINLHGGGFRVGAGVVSALESIPVASLGKIKVITVDYRQAPEYRYPAATEDVVTVYRELLKIYSPESIGIYGCSAGGLLTAEVVAWLSQQQLPEPGAVGIFCASAAGWAVGDSGAMAPRLNGLPVPADTVGPPHPQVTNALYFAEADLDDPLVLPIRSDALLSKFPPTLLLTSTRDAAMSGVVYTHTQLTRLGVDAELHVWDGLGHAFFTSEPDLRESREALDVITKFFDRHLAANR